MNGCEHFTIRDFVSEVRERDWRLTFPLPLPPDMTPEQIKALLPPMESSQFKRWNCARCVAEFFQGDHCAQYGAGGLPSDDDEHVTRKDNFMADKINVVDTSAIVPADVKTTDYSDLLNTEKPKALLFDLNETPTPEDSDEILEINEAAATEELAIMDNTAECRHIPNLAPVDEKHYIGNTNEPAIRSIEADDSIEDEEDDIIPQTIRRKLVKYRALSELSDQDKREEFQNVDSNGGTDHEMVPTPDPQPKKKIKLNKKKKKKSQEKQGPEGCRAAPEKSKKKRTFDFNFLQAGASLQSPAAPCLKRKHHQVSPDQNENSDTLVSDSSEKGTAGAQKEIGKKRRIFGDKVLKTSKDADQSSQFESGAIHRKIHKHRASLERVNVVVEHGNSLPTQREEAAIEEADQQRSGGAKQKKKNSSISSGSASENNRSTDDKRLTVVGKELVLRDRPNSTIAKDVQNETVNKLLPKNKRVFVDQALKEHGELCQPKSGIIINKKIHNRPVSVQRVKSSAIEKQNLNPVGENETESSTQTKRPAGKDTKGMLGAQPRKRNCSEKFKGKDVNQQMIIVAQQQKKNESDIRSSASKKRGPPIVGRESPPALRNTLTVSPIHSRQEKAMNGIHLLSIVATEHEELRAMSESDTRITEDIHYALSADKVPPSKSDIPALGYDGCVQVTVPTDYLLIDEEGDPFKLGPEDLPLRSHRLLKLGSKKVSWPR